jgi:hypothetical protein
MALPGTGALVLVGGGSLAVVGSIFALWTYYVDTIEAVSDTGGEVVPAPPVMPEIPAELRPQADQVINGYEDHYFGPIDQVGNQVADPAAPDPVPKPIPRIPADAAR